MKKADKEAGRDLAKILKKQNNFEKMLYKRSFLCYTILVFCKMLS